MPHRSALLLFLLLLLCHPPSHRLAGAPRCFKDERGVEEECAASATLCTRQSAEVKRGRAHTQHPGFKKFVTQIYIALYCSSKFPVLSNKHSRRNEKKKKKTPRWINHTETDLGRRREKRLPENAPLKRELKEHTPLWSSDGALLLGHAVFLIRS